MKHLLLYLETQLEGLYPITLETQEMIKEQRGIHQNFKNTLRREGYRECINAVERYLDQEMQKRSSTDG